MIKLRGYEKESFEATPNKQIKKKKKRNVLQKHFEEIKKHSRKAKWLLQVS